METTLIANGGGFLGSHLCRKLLGQGNEVICVDNFYTGVKQKSPILWTVLIMS